MMMELKDVIYCGDCIEIMKQIPEASIAGCVTDPPYNYEFIGRNWDASEIRRRTQRVKDSSTLVKNIPYGSGLAGGVRNAAWYERNRKNTLAYREWCGEWGRELFRITKPGAFVLIFNSTRSVAQVQVAMEDAGFYARDMIAWRRHSGIPRGLNAAKKLEKMGCADARQWEGWHSCLRSEWEAIAVVQKPLMNSYITTLQESGVGLFHVASEAGFQSNIIEGIRRDAPESCNIHCTVKPVELIEKLVRMIMPASDGNILIDPFIGSGTSALACRRAGVHYLGIEICSEYVEIARQCLRDMEKAAP